MYPLFTWGNKGGWELEGSASPGSNKQEKEDLDGYRWIRPEILPQRAKRFWKIKAPKEKLALFSTKIYYKTTGRKSQWHIQDLTEVPRKEGISPDPSIYLNNSVYDFFCFVFCPTEYGVPRPGSSSQPQPQHCWFLNPLCWAGDQTCVPVLRRRHQSLASLSGLKDLALP